MIWAEQVKNRAAVPATELAKYQGEHIAWSLDDEYILSFIEADAG
jgi:hypothetical protein